MNTEYPTNKEYIEVLERTLNTLKNLVNPHIIIYDVIVDIDKILERSRN